MTDPVAAVCGAHDLVTAQTNINNAKLQVHPGLIELDPEDCVIVVNYEVRLGMLYPTHTDLNTPYSSCKTSLDADS